MVMQEQAPPTPTEAEEPTATEGQVDGDGDAAGETQADSIDSLLERFNPEQLVSHPKLSEIVKSTVESEVKKAEDRTRNRMMAESRRRYGDPQVVRDSAKAILREAGLDGDLTRSQEDRLNNLIATFEQQSAQKVANEIPGVFFGNYKLPQDVLDSYSDHVADGDYDGAFKALVDGAVALSTSRLEADFEKRVEARAKEIAKAELNRPSDPAKLPSTSRGGVPASTSRSLTTAEIDKLPSSVWVKLPQEVKDEIKANAVEADRERGAQTVDLNRLQSLASMAR